MATIKEKAKTAIADITRLLFGEQQKFMDATLKDGSVIKIDGDEIKEGAAVTDAEGNPVKDGDYTLENETVITCAEGKVTKVVEAAKAEEAKTGTEAEAMKAATAKFGTGTPEERIGNLELCVKPLMEYSFGWQIREAEEKAARDAAIEVYTTQMSSQKSEIATLKDQLNKTNEAFKIMMALVTDLADQPVATSAEPSRTNFQADKPDPADKIKQIADIVTKFKKN